METRLFCPYRQAVAWQLDLVARRIDDDVPDTLLVVEHEPVVTLGSSARDAHLLLDGDQYVARGITVVRSDRGGDVTYHGPGQVVLYPIVKLEEGDRDLHRYLRNLEEAGIRTLAGYGVRGFRSPGRTGIWTDAGKIAAIGVHVRRWVTYHGMALNVDVDLAAFSTIVPCGLDDPRVTSLAEAGAAPSEHAVEEVGAKLVSACRSVFDRPFVVLRGEDCPGYRAAAGTTERRGDSEP